MVKFGLGKVFQYNSELSAFRLFGKVEVWWRPGDWKRPSKWVFEFNHIADCDCHMFECGFFGTTFLGKNCDGRYY